MNINIKINTDFDSGSIEVIDLSNHNNILLKLRKENSSQNKQWFHFELETIVGVSNTIKIVNASEATFAKAWTKYQVVGSYDKRHF